MKAKTGNSEPGWRGVDKVTRVEVVDDAPRNRLLITAEGQATVSSDHEVRLKKDDKKPIGRIYHFELQVMDKGDDPVQQTVRATLSFRPKDMTDGPPKKVKVLGRDSPTRTQSVDAPDDGPDTAYPRFDTLAGLLEYLADNPELVDEFGKDAHAFLAGKQQSARTKLAAMYHFVAEISDESLSLDGDDSKVTLSKNVPLDYTIPGGLEEPVFLEKDSYMTYKKEQGGPARVDSLRLETYVPGAEQSDKDKNEEFGATLIIHTIEIQKDSETGDQGALRDPAGGEPADGKPKVPDTLLVGPASGVTVVNHRYDTPSNTTGFAVPADCKLTGFLASRQGKDGKVWDLSLLLTMEPK